MRESPKQQAGRRCCCMPKMRIFAALWREERIWLWASDGRRLASWSGRSTCRSTWEEQSAGSLPQLWSSVEGKKRMLVPHRWLDILSYPQSVRLSGRNSLRVRAKATEGGVDHHETANERVLHSAPIGITQQVSGPDSRSGAG